MGILNFIKPAPHTEPIKDQQKVDKSYKYWRFRIFYSMYIGYAFFYFTRKSFTFAMPSLITELGMTKTELGVLGSLLYLSYGVSKFVSGVLSDKSNPRFIMAMGLLLTGVFNICFGFSNSIWLFGLFWCLNGWFQGWGWPPCARLLTHWYSQKERGTWWGFWNSSHNIGGALIPIIVAYAIAMFGSWRFGMWLPGAMSIVASLFLFNRLRDTPQSLGLPSIEKHRNDYPSNSKSESEEELSVRELLVKYILKNKFMWLLAISYFFIYIIRTAINDWGLMYLKEVKQLSFIQAGYCIGAFEVGGILGSLSAGWVSDKMFAGRRGPINLLFTFGSILSLVVMWMSEVNMFAIQLISMSFIGFFIFGPQMLIGMAAAELSHKKAAGTATGFVGWIAYFGATITLTGGGTIIDKYGWSALFGTLVVGGVIAMIILAPLWNAKSRKEEPA
ncbi:MFS transporter family glucose-6-phosphate receptor UhpC [Candidatus Aerophobetes bacterium]|uniref:MFS transporter family glucose-6-phosphate receptor UhpC n=1 Tax=Aerophobetes bacterium TaxID=2030807 RepID=A0A2A4YKR1_UNCAE|nr:MAG: MFS transporter family glucose-6-phosphate receptor UhpC [Candidatus Aerophobetes bacterium]